MKIPVLSVFLVTTSFMFAALACVLFGDKWAFLSFWSGCASLVTGAMSIVSFVSSNDQ